MSTRSSASDSRPRAPPAQVSASIHAAEVFTTAASAGSHTVNKNVNWKLFVPLALGGVVGGGIGAFVLTSLDGDVLKPFITAYLAIMGAVALGGLGVFAMFRIRGIRLGPLADALAGVLA